MLNNKMYRIQKGDELVGYLLGTMHFSLCDITQHPFIKNNLDKCESLWLERTPENFKEDLKKSGINLRSHDFSDISEEFLKVSKGMDIQLYEYFKKKKLLIGPLEKYNKKLVNNTINILKRTQQKFNEIQLLKGLKILQSTWNHYLGIKKDLNFPISEDLKNEILDDRDDAFVQKMSNILDSQECVPLFCCRPDAHPGNQRKYKKI